MLIFTNITKVFAVRSGSLFRVEYRLKESESFKTPVPFVELMDDFNNIADIARKEFGKLKSELEKLGFNYIELYKHDGQDDGLQMSLSDDGHELVMSQKGNLHQGFSSWFFEKTLEDLGYKIIEEE